MSLSPPSAAIAPEDEPRLACLQQLRALTCPPSGPGWNHAEFEPLVRPIPAAVLVGLRRLPQPRLILTVRHARLQAHAGQVAFPGGRIDRNDRDPLAAALRECEEEIGIPAQAIAPLGYLDCYDTWSGYRITPVVAWVEAEVAYRAEPAEVAEIFEVPLGFLSDPQHLQHPLREWRGRRHAMAEFDYAGHRIWGATAAILTRWLHGAAAARLLES